MTDASSKRKYAGPTVAELRKVDQTPLKLPPHKKPKVWTLTVEWEIVEKTVATKSFSSRADRDEFRRRVERHQREKATAESRGERYTRYWNNPLHTMKTVSHTRLKPGAVITESYEDAPPHREPDAHG